jgi:hypothetical protein
MALIARDLIARTTVGERVTMMLLVWLGGGWGLFLTIFSWQLPEPLREGWLMAAPSVGAPFLFVAAVLAFRALRRPVMPGTA